MMAAASKSAKVDIIDPLRAMSSPTAASQSNDPISNGIGPKTITTIETVSYGEVKTSIPDASTPIAANSRLASGLIDGYEPWRDKRANILTKYTTNKKIPVQANFLEEEKVAAPKAVDSAKSRLEELEAEAEAALNEGKISMTQKEYITHIEEQHERLKVAWEAGERVTSLKIAIQCAKLLGDSSVPQFYPSMYVLLTDILDTFGDLVFERIKRKGQSTIHIATHTLQFNVI